MKVCTGCMISKPTIDFALNCNTKDGLNGRCRTCYSKRYNAERIVARRPTTYKKNFQKDPMGG